MTDRCLLFAWNTAGLVSQKSNRPYSFTGTLDKVTVQLNSPSETGRWLLGQSEES
jgi:hypothetical protein